MQGKSSSKAGLASTYDCIPCRPETHPPSELPAINNKMHATRLMIRVTSKPNHWMYSCVMVDWCVLGKSLISWRIIGKTGG